jgi:hypothetical protein
MLTPLGLSSSFGFGDRLGIATPGHIAAVIGTKFAPVFAQQSVRENARTGRTPQQVMDDAKRAVEAAKWDVPWGADADHLKTVDDLPPFVAAGYTFFTVDPGAHVDNAADMDSQMMLQEKARRADLDELSDRYLHPAGKQPWGEFDLEKLLRAEVKYGQAIRHTVGMYRRLSQMKDNFDFEVSVDETDSPTSPLEHFFIASELIRKGVHFTSLAPRFIGRFEKGVDYIGDLATLDTEMAKHAAVTAYFGTYKISLHSGSDKFSVYPLIAKHWAGKFHVKTAGTSYLEALRLIAKQEPDLFKKIYSLSCAQYEADRRTYHVSAKLDLLPRGNDFPSLLENFHAREIMHVTFGSVLDAYGAELKAALIKHEVLYLEDLKAHFHKHLELLK